MYMALLAGGQIIRGLQRKAMALPRDKGGAVFTFEELRDGGVSAVKTSLKAALDELGERIKDAHHSGAGVIGDGGGMTSSDAWAWLVREKASIFTRNDALVASVARRSAAAGRGWAGTAGFVALAAIRLTWQWILCGVAIAALTYLTLFNKARSPFPSE